jgi:hypothetical protein
MRAKVEKKRRQAAFPLMYAELWHNDAPKTSQRTALLPLCMAATLVLFILGGNRTGKSLLMAMWLVASALGEDYCIETKRGKVYPVREWLRRNGLPADLIAKGPGEMWAASPNFSVAKGQIRRWIRRYSPTGSRFLRWDNPQEAEVIFPNGGKIVSKAYKQYDQDPQTWEGANVRGIGLDEQPNSYECFLAGLSRLIDQRGKMVNALTPLRGKNNWLYKECVGPEALSANPDYRVSKLHGEDNPHIPAEWWAKIMAKYPAWQRAAREHGEFVSPEGAVYTLSEAHIVQPFPLPNTWRRFVGVDWGAVNPHVTWIAQVRERFSTPCGRVLERGDLLCYREFARRLGPKEQRFTTARLIGEGLRIEAGKPEGLRMCEVYRVADSADPDAIEEAADLGWYLAPSRKGAGSIQRGIDLVEGRLALVDPVTRDETTGELASVRPRLYFSRDCPVLIEEMMGLLWAEGAEGDDAKPDETCPDHGPDTVRYVVQYIEDEGWDAAI